MRDTANSGSNPLGVYATIGDLGFAVADTDSMIMFYRAQAYQVDWTIGESTSLSYALKYIPDYAIVSSMSSGHFLTEDSASHDYKIGYRDFVVGARPYSYTSIVVGEEIILENPPDYPSYDTVDVWKYWRKVK